MDRWERRWALVLGLGEEGRVLLLMTVSGSQREERGEGPLESGHYLPGAFCPLC